MFSTCGQNNNKKETDLFPRGMRWPILRMTGRPPVGEPCQMENKFSFKNVKFGN